METIQAKLVVELSRRTVFFDAEILRSTAVRGLLLTGEKTVRTAII